MLDLLIKGGTLPDGTSGDIAIKGDRIAAVGRVVAQAGDPPPPESPAGLHVGAMVGQPLERHLRSILQQLRGGAQRGAARARRLRAALAPGGGLGDAQQQEQQQEQGRQPRRRVREPDWSELPDDEDAGGGSASAASRAT